MGTLLLGPAVVSSNRRVRACVCVGSCLYLELGDDIMEYVLALTAGRSCPHTWCVRRLDFFLENVSSLTVQLYYKGPQRRIHSFIHFFFFFFLGWLTGVFKVEKSAY